MTDRSTTTQRLEHLMAKHADQIDRLTRRFGLPLHVFFIEEMRAQADGYHKVLRDRYPESTVAFAVKSNPCRGALRAAAALGLGADVASEYELRAALEEGIAPDSILCNGNAKSAVYLDLALEAGALLALDNEDELRLLAPRAAAPSRDGKDDLRVLVRLRGMPLSGLTSDDQTTAADWTKFGFHITDAEAVFSEVDQTTGLQFHGVSAHIGTQIASPRGHELLLEHLLGLAEAAQRRGQRVSCLDIGGGFPIAFLDEAQWKQFTERLQSRLRGELPAQSSPTWNDLPMGYAHFAHRDEEKPAWIGKAYWSAYPASEMLAYVLTHRSGDTTVVERLEALGRPRLIVEPGRSLMAPAGVTLVEAAGVKTVLGQPVVSLDMGINNHGTNLISPDIFPAAVLPRRTNDCPVHAFLAGRLCFSGDMISKATVPLNRLPKPGEHCVVFHTGAYSADHFASNSCGFPRPGKVAIDADGAAQLWRAPQTFTDVFGDASDQLAIGE